MDSSSIVLGLAEGLPGLLGPPGLISEAVASEASEAVASEASETVAQPGQGQEGQAGLHTWLDNRGLDTYRVDQVQTLAFIRLYFLLLK